MARPTTAVRFDPRSAELIEDPHPVWRRAREEQPVFHSPELDVWIVTRYDDALAVLKDPRRFVSRDSFDPAVPLPADVQAILAEGWENFLVVNVDQPEHTPVRKAVNRALKRSKVEEATPLIRKVATDLVDGFVARGRADLNADFAHLLPALVVGDIVGVPRDEVPNILRWGHDFETILAATEPAPELERAARGLREYQAYFIGAIQDRRRHPQDDLLTAIVEEFDGDPELGLTTEQLANIPLAVFTAGHNTTARSICNAVLLLLRHDEARRMIEQDPALIPNAVEEILRYEAPFPFVRRTVTEDVEIDGTPIPEGATVMLALASANYDGCKFAQDPARLDICRADANRHLTFGNGTHFCPGAPLARRELEIAIETLFARLPNLRLTGYERMPTFAHRGFTRFEVAWEIP